MSRKSSRPRCPTIRYDDQVEVAVNSKEYEFPLGSSKMGPAHDGSVRKVDPEENARALVEKAQWKELQRNKCCSYRSFPTQIKKLNALRLSPNAKNQWVPCSYDLKGGLRVEDCGTLWWRTVGDAHAFFRALGRVNYTAELPTNQETEKQRRKREKKERKKESKKRKREQMCEQRKAAAEATIADREFRSGAEKVQEADNHSLALDDINDDGDSKVGDSFDDVDTSTGVNSEDVATVTNLSNSVTHPTPITEDDHRDDQQEHVQHPRQQPCPSEALVQQIVKILSDKSKIALGPQLDKTLADIGLLNDDGEIDGEYIRYLDNDVDVAGIVRCFKKLPAVRLRELFRSMAAAQVMIYDEIEL